MTSLAPSLASSLAGRLIKASALTASPKVAAREFKAIHAATADAPLTEIAPEGAGDVGAALGFALAWARSAPGDGLVLFAAPEHVFTENGGFLPEGLAQFGVDLRRFLLIRTRTRDEALWATEQALATPRVTVICALAPDRRGLSLVATRRLLLWAQTHKTRCLLLRLDGAGASAAWTRWMIAAAGSAAPGRELGGPAFAVRLDRNRAGPSHLSWMLRWIAHERRFDAAAGGALDGAVAAGFAHRPDRPRGRRAA